MHINDFVSFGLRLVIELVPVDESQTVRDARMARWAWLVERDYKVIDIAAPEVEADVAAVLGLARSGY